MKFNLSNIVSQALKTVRKKGAHAVVDQAVISGLNFVTFLMLAKWMTTPDFGQYILTFSVLIFLQTVQHSLITRGHNVLGAKAPDSEYRQLTQGVVKLVCGFAASFTIVALLAGTTFQFYSLETWAISALGLVIVIIPWLLQDAVRRILYTSDRIIDATLNDFVCYALQVVAIWVLMSQGFAGTILTVFLVFGASSLVAALFGLVQLRSELAGISQGDGSLKVVVSRLWGFGKWLTTGEFIGWIGQNGNTWIVAAILGAPLVAGYRAATYVTNLLNPLDLSVSNYLPVKAAQIVQTDGRLAMISWLKKQALYLCVPYAIVVIGLSIGSIWLLDLFFDERYATELFALVLSISAIGRLLGFGANFARLGLMATENNRPIMYSQVISLVVFLTCSIGFVSWLGVSGAPLARIVLHIFVGLYLTMTLVKPSSTFPFKLTSVSS